MKIKIAQTLFTAVLYLGVTTFSTQAMEEADEKDEFLQLALQESLNLHEISLQKDDIIKYYEHFCLDPLSIDIMWEAISNSPETIALCKKFVDIYKHIETISNDTDVHQLDNYIFGPTGIMSDLLKIGQILQLDNDGLSWLEIKENLIAFYPQTTEDLITTYIEEKKENDQIQEICHPITRTSLLGQINHHFDTIPTELAALFTENPARIDEFRQLCSRMFTLTLAFQNAGHDQCKILLAQSLAENYITQGGCLQGRINRIAIRYISLLGATGLRSLAEIVSGD